MSAIAAIPQNTELTADVRSALKTSLYPGAHDDSVGLVLAYCRAARLDPMTKPVHIVPMWDGKARAMRDVVMPGIGLYRTIAARSGCAGVSEPEFGPDVDAVIDGVAITYPKWCKVTARRQLENGAIAEFTARELWLENYAEKGGQEKSPAPNAMWRKRPYGQLAKCAEAQALRKAFPEVGAMPTAEEMEGKAISEDGHTDARVVSTITQARTEPQPYPADSFATNFPKWRAVIQSGTKSAADIVAMVTSKGALSDEQVKAIHDCTPIEGEAQEVAA